MAKENLKLSLHFAMLAKRVARGEIIMNIPSRSGDEQWVIEKYEEISKRWKFSYRLWIITHYTLGIAMIGLSASIAANMAAQFPNVDGKTIGWMLALLTGTATFLDPQGRASRFSRAWLELNNKLFQYKGGCSHTNLEEVIHAHTSGERIIYDEPRPVKPQQLRGVKNGQQPRGVKNGQQAPGAKNGRQPAREAGPDLDGIPSPAKT